jgi:hypothetical protein
MKSKSNKFLKKNKIKIKNYSQKLIFLEIPKLFDINLRYKIINNKLLITQ